MNDTNNTISKAAEDLALIREMMDAGRKRASIDGNFMILWGALLMIAFVAQYAALTGHLNATIWHIWLPVLVVGNLASFYIGKKNPFKSSCDNALLAAYSSAWAMIGISIMIYFFASMLSGTFDPKSITLLAAALYGSAFFVIARISGIKTLYIFAIGWWLLLAYVAAVLESFDHELVLVMAGASAILILLPGQIMRRAAKTKQNDTED